MPDIGSSTASLASTGQSRSQLVLERLSRDEPYLKVVAAMDGVLRDVGAGAGGTREIGGSTHCCYYIDGRAYRSARDEIGAVVHLCYVSTVALNAQREPPADLMRGLNNPVNQTGVSFCG